jgi:deoxyadenosine/deoxycytidine kinase
MIIAVDGLIGAGKTTLLRQLKNRGYTVILEPTHEWKFMDKFYEDQNKYALAFQLEVLLSFNKYVIPSDEIVFVERCPQVCRMVFAKMLAADGTMTNEEMTTFSDIYDKLHIWEPDHYLYLDCPIDMCEKRIQTRGDDCEITTSYLTNLKKYYDIFLRYTNSEIIDSNRDASDIEKDVLDFVDRVFVDRALPNKPAAGER